MKSNPTPRRRPAWDDEPSTGCLLAAALFATLYIIFWVVIAVLVVVLLVKLIGAFG